MTLDKGLCEAYLDMPAAHWDMAQAALTWMQEDAMAEKFLQAAMESLACGDSAGAAKDCRAAKAYAARTRAQYADGVCPAIFASALPQTLQRMAAAGIDDGVAHDTLSDYGIWARSYERATGHAGIDEIEWNVHFFTGRIVRLGRLQFERARYHAPYTFYRDYQGGAMHIVPHEGLKIDAYGHLVQEDPTCFVTQRTDDSLCVTYNRVDTRMARIVEETQTLRLADVECVLTTGAPVLNIHVPEIGPLDDAAVKESFKRARLFFEGRGIENRFAVCESWLLDPALEQYGRECKNILAFQRRFMRYTETWYSDACSRVFGRGLDYSRLETLPEETRLQRGLKAYLRAQGRLRIAGGVVEL